MNILLTGASGFIGKQLSHTLIKNGHTVIACSHKKKVQVEPNLTQLQVDFMQMRCSEDWFQYLNGVDVVINTVGIIAETKNQTFDYLHNLAPVSLFEACVQTEVKRVIQISALGADDTAIVPYHLSKKLADDALQEMDLEWFILRPSLIVGEGGTSFSLFQKLSNLPIIFLFGDGEQMIQPIEIKEVIATVLRCLDDGVEAKQIIDLVGEEAISYKDWMMSLRTRKASVRYISVPMLIMMKLSIIGKYINLPLFNPDSLTMLQQDNVADRSGLMVFLDKKPQSLKQCNEVTL